jgi:hypothetical protein
LNVAVNHGGILKMLSENFKHEEAKEALEKLKTAEVIDNVKRHNIGEKFFEDLVKVTSTLISEGKLPKIRVLSSEILRIPRPEVADLDNVAVGARMEVMDKRMEGVEKNMNEMMKNMQALMVKSVLQVPAQGASHPGAAYAAAAAAGTGREAGQQRVDRRRASISNNLEVPTRPRLNSKRAFEEMDEDIDEATVKAKEKEWVEPKPRRRKVNYGKAKVETGRSDEAVAPFEIFIANTHPQSTKELIKELLIECAASDKDRNAALEIIEVKCMTNKERVPNPRTLCWKVTIPHRERLYMLKDESYPEGWAHRRFFPPRQNVPLLKPGIPNAKQPRLDVENADNVGA